MNHIAFLIAVLLTLGCTNKVLAQTNNKMGYYVTNEGDTLKRRIQYQPNMTTAKSLLVSASGSEKFLELAKSEVKAFGIYGLSEYERHITIIDKSSDNIEDLIEGEKDNVEIDTFFLKKLVDGPIKIFIYTDINRGDQFFYQKENDAVKPLFKRLMVDEKMVVRENMGYLFTLRSILTCESIKEVDFENLQYRREEISSIVYKHNKCINPNSPRPNSLRSKFVISLSVRGGVVFNSLDFTGNLRLFQIPDETLISGLGYQAGVQLKLTPSIYNQPLAFFAEPTLFSFTANNLSEEKSSTETISAKLTSVQIPIGVHLAPISKNNYKIFASGGISPTVWSKSDIAFNRFDEVQSNLNFQYFYGAGIATKKINAELRFNSKGGEIYSRGNYGFTQSKLAFIIGYQLY